MRKLRNYAMLGLIGLLGIITIGVTRANTIVTPLGGVVVEYTLNSGFDTASVFTAGVLQIDDGETKIFILDRNLGATETGITCSLTDLGSCGYHFQWGNNYGFTMCTGGVGCTSVLNGERKSNNRVSSENVYKGYMENLYVTHSNGWISDNSKIDMWGGDKDDNIDSLSGFNWQVTNPSDRQGPCPEDFHVPSYGELLKIENMMNNDANIIHSDLLIPFAAGRSYLAGLYGLENIGYLWSSSPCSSYNTNCSWDFRIDSDGNAELHLEGRSDASSVRCVYNSYKAQVSCLQSGEIPEHSHYNIENVTITRDEETGWSEPSNCSFVCDDGYYGSNCDASIIHDTGANITYTDTNGKIFTGIGTITLTVGSESFTILDRNLGAETSSSFSDSLSGSLGYYFQRGNNFGFISKYPVVSEKSGNCDAKYLWNSPYVKDTIVSGYVFREKDIWGGSGDMTSNHWGENTLENGYKRQGPCPAGFHVPSQGEWNKFLEIWFYKKNGSQVGLYSSNGLHYFYGNQYLGTLFLNDFLMPKSSSCWAKNDGSIGCAGDRFDGWSSSNFYYADTRPSTITMIYGGNDDSRSLKSVRCFQDKTGYLVVSYETNGGTAIQSQTIVSGEKAYLPGHTTKKTGAVLLGWSTSAESSYLLGLSGVDFDYIVTGDITLYAKWGYEYTIKDRDGIIIETGIIAEGGDISISKNPEREGYTFAGRDKSLDNITEDLIVTAIYEENKRSNGGGSTLKKDSCPNGDFSDSYYDGICGENPKDSSLQTTQNDEQTSQDDEQTSQDDGGNNELQTAYEFAYENKITTMDSIEKADMEGGLTRIAMAKMLSKYAINVLGKKPANTIVPKFSDITEGLNAEYDYGVSLAYQLGIMGINMPNNKFRPFDNVTRAEFVTALSRLLYNTEDGKILYYSTHMELLNKMGIITVTDPDMKELRGYVMLMLMRSAK